MDTQREQERSEQRKVIAEFMGWHEYVDDTVLMRWKPGVWWQDKDGQIDTFKSLPDYHHDLNAMHEVVLELAKKGLGYEYYAALHDIALDGRPEVPLRYFVGRHLILLTEATAEQRATAAARVIATLKEQENEREG